MSTILRGPADADHYRVQVGRYGDRWYTDPLPGCSIAPASDWTGPSISTVKKASGADWSFVSLGRAADDIANNPGRYDGLTRSEVYDTLNGANKRGLNRAAGRGTLVHLWAEDLLNGRPMRPVGALDLQALRLDRGSLDDAMQYQAALSAFFAEHRPELVATEIVCLHRTLNGVGYGGTADAVLSIGGKLYLADWKTRGADSSHGAYPEEAAQVSALAGAQYAIALGATGPQRIELPEMAGGLVVSIKPDGYRAYPVDLDAGFAHWSALHAWWVARRDERKAVGRPWAPKGSADAPADPQRDALRSRVAWLLDNGHEERLRVLWPADVPPLSQAGHTPAQYAQIGALLDRIETAVSAPFAVTAPAPAPEEPAPAPAPAVVTVDEGGLVDDQAYNLLSGAFASLAADRAELVSGIAAEAAAVGRPLSMDQLRSVRRWEIGRALVRWANSGLSPDEFAVAVCDIATPEQVAAAADTVGGLLSLFTAAQADQLAGRFDPVAVAAA